MTATESVPTTDVPWHLRDNQAPVPDEVTLFDLEVRGSIPTELRGRFVRNGPNPRSGASSHWFFGDGMLHGLALEDGRAQWYRNRWVRTPCYEHPERDRFSMMVDANGRIDHRVSVANTHVVAHAGRILALEEAGFPYEVTPDLETVGVHDFAGGLTGAMTAHPKICPETGEMLFFGYGLLPPHLTYYRADAGGRLVQREEITVHGATMHHDFAASRNHVVFMDLPAVFDLEAAIRGGMPVRWSDDYPARFGVMPRAGTDAEVVWFDVEPCYVFHTLNAHEEGDTVVVRGCRMPDLWRDSSAIVMDPGGANAPASRLHEWRLDLATGRVTERSLDDQASDFPRVADADAGLPARYGFTVSLESEAPYAEILKHDLEQGTKVRHRFPDGHAAGEPVFVRAAGATQPDDGWVMTYVHDGGRGTSYLVILDASDLTGAPVAEVHLPRRIPTGFHGSWIATAG